MIITQHEKAFYIDYQKVRKRFVCSDNKAITKQNLNALKKLNGTKLD